MRTGFYLCDRPLTRKITTHIETVFQHVIGGLGRARDVGVSFVLTEVRLSKEMRIIGGEGGLTARKVCMLGEMLGVVGAVLMGVIVLCVKT